MARKSFPLQLPGLVEVEVPLQVCEAALQKLKEASEDALDELRPTKYAESMKEAAKTVQRSVGSMKRALAGFDEITQMTRLKTTTQPVKSQEQLLLEYLNSVDFKQIIARLQLFRGQINQCGEEMVALVSKIYLLDLAIDQQNTQLQRFATNFLTISAYINTVGTALQRLSQLTTHWNNQAGHTSAVASTLKLSLSGLQAQLESLNTPLNSARLHGSSLSLQLQTLQELSGKLSSSLSVLRSRFAGLLDEKVRSELFAGLTGADSLLRQQLFKLQTYLQTGFFPQWKQAWTRIAGVIDGQMSTVPGSVKSSLNITIDLFNRFLARMTKGFNSWITSQNQLQLKLGQITGTPVVRIPAMVTPTIPHLAKGAVLPPNKPFMAVVGDQKHGTNVEAPLATIQEAVALVMQDFVSSNMAGHQATVAALREILQAVLGISIGDDVIGAAAQRYRSKMAVVTGGAL